VHLQVLQITLTKIKWEKNYFAKKNF